MGTATGSSVLMRGFRLALSVEGLKRRTIDNYLRDVERFAEHHDNPKSVKAADIRAYILSLQEKCAPKTVYEAQLGLRRFFRFLVREGEINRDPYRQHATDSVLWRGKKGALTGSGVFIRAVIQENPNEIPIDILDAVTHPFATTD